MRGGDRWTFACGPYGYRVRVRERRRGGNVYLFSYDPDLGGNRKTSLGYPVRDADGDLIEHAVEKAKAAAAQASNALITGASPHDDDGEDPTTVGELFDAFRRDEVRDMNDRHRRGVSRDLELLERFLGRDAEVAAIGRSEWNAVRRARGSGEIDARGRRVPESTACPDCDAGDPGDCPRCDGTGRVDPRREVGPRTVAKTLKVLRQACRFGVDARVLDRDPTRGLDLPRERDPRAPVCSDELLAKLLDAAPEVLAGRGKREDRDRSPLRELLIVAAHTGARIGEIVRLRWSDWRPDDDRSSHGTIRWRGEHQKNGRTRVTPVTRRVREALEAHRRRRPGVGEAWIFPAPDSDGHVSVGLALDWWRRAEDRAGVDHRKGMGFHALRRRWACRMKEASPVDAAALGGWKDVATMQRVYQRADLAGMERALLGGGDDDGDREAAAGGGP